MGIDDYRRHSAYSDPGRHGGLLDAVAADIPTVAATARNVIVHYRAGGVELPDDRLDEVNCRWVGRILDTDQSRFPLPLTAERPAVDRVAGCCRDHTLLSVAVLRQHGVPSRSRVGFASYFVPGWHHDHVLVEYWDGHRWVWADPEVDPAGGWGFDGYDIDPKAGLFDSAARVWAAYRAGTIDPDVYGVAPDVSAHGGWFIYDYVLHELAHRQKDELLLWDSFGAMTDDLADADLTLADEIAALLLAADDGDEAAEKALADRYATDSRLRPGARIRTFSPVSGTVSAVDLRLSRR
ncbi:transglutaminase domain-containing protein [Micromonospora inaquosa]|uniref:Transglutaminase n=1 Tax=Micromonospora inaquosa TaxID=2203716 RepID=A0A3N9X1X4_9ACTN|nr:transglutaminase domain-containing protein [Micromonospora inaquosa]RQX07106.1 transglutaminase [Micromonospora inaquosa]